MRIITVTTGAAALLLLGACTQQEIDDFAAALPPPPPPDQQCTIDGGRWNPDTQYCWFPGDPMSRRPVIIEHPEPVIVPVERHDTEPVIRIAPTLEAEPERQEPARATPAKPEEKKDEDRK